jgi:hypothetical protein
MKNSLKDLLAEGKTAQVLAALQQSAALDADDQNLVRLLAARYAENERRQHAGTLAHETYRVERNSINAAVLAVLAKLPDGRVSNPVPGYSKITFPTQGRASTMKNLLYFLAVVIALVAIGYLFQWYKAEPENREPLPALLSAVSSLLLVFIAWRMEGNDTTNHPPSSAGENRRVTQNGPKSIYIEKNEGDININ